MTLTHQLVAQLGGVALVNRITARGWAAPVRLVAIVEAGARKIGLRRRLASELSPPVRAFVGIVHRVCADFD